MKNKLVETIGGVVGALISLTIFIGVLGVIIYFGLKLFGIL